jgi:hypothetical protein
MKEGANARDSLAEAKAGWPTTFWLAAKEISGYWDTPTSLEVIIAFDRRIPSEPFRRH